MFEHMWSRKDVFVEVFFFGPDGVHSQRTISESLVRHLLTNKSPKFFDTRQDISFCVNSKKWLTGREGVEGEGGKVSDRGSTKSCPYDHIENHITTISTSILRINLLPNPYSELVSSGV